MTTTTTAFVYDPEILTETVRGQFAQKDAFRGTSLLDLFTVNGSLPQGKQKLGRTITIPYFGVIGEMEDLLAEDAALTPDTLGQVSEEATVYHSGKAIEVTRWAQLSGQDDPYKEGASQILAMARRFVARKCIAVAAANGVAYDKYSATTPRYLDYDLLVDATTEVWGDEGEDAVALVHSKTYGDIVKIKDATGKPLVTDITQGDKGPGKVVAGFPMIRTNMAPLTGSTMGTVTAYGSPTTTLALTVSTTAGNDITKFGPWNLVVKCTTAGNLGTAKVKFSTDGGSTWSDEITTALTTVAKELIDPNYDSVVGNNGRTGLTMTFTAAGGELALDTGDYWTSKATVKASTLIIRPGSVVYYYDGAEMGFQTDRNILKNNDIGALHQYYACHMYRRHPQGTKPGVIVLKHNVTAVGGA